MYTNRNLILFNGLEPISVNICDRLLLLLALAHVRLDVEVEEHDKEHASVEDDDPAKDLRESAVLLEEREGGVEEEGDKLYKLHSRQIPFPPQILLKSRTKCG